LSICEVTLHNEHYLLCCKSCRHSYHLSVSGRLCLKYSSKLVEGSFKEEGTLVIPLPLKSSDLKPIENMWHDIDG
jgi:hypothetical protein